MEHFLSTDLRSDAHQSQIIGGMQMKTILKLLGGMQSIYWGIYPPHPPLVLAPLPPNYVKIFVR